MIAILNFTDDLMRTFTHTFCSLLLFRSVDFLDFASSRENMVATVIQAHTLTTTFEWLGCLLWVPVE